MPDAAHESKATTRNAFSKISGMFGRGQKPRWIQDFHILFSHSDPNRRYKAGDVVRGEVHIRPSKPVRVTHITLALYGYAQVFKTFNAPGDGQSKEASHADPGRLLTSPGIVKLFTPVERTLHGECKLPSRLLKFQFAIPLPSHRLPTSIDFERGTISYQLVATITRPTAIAPVLRCEPRKLYINEDIDVAMIPAPKPRMVTLEPVEPKSKARRRKKAGSNSSDQENITPPPQEPPDSPRSSVSHSRSGSRASFTHSDNASVSNCSESIEFRLNTNHTNNANSNSGSGHGSGGGGGSNRNSRSGTPANSSKVVYASAEVTRGGFLPGDKIPVRVLVSHTKPIRSMCGVIVTLYRKTHIDTQPVLHRQVVDANGQTRVMAVTPDVYTRSLTGLGGLSLSNSGTSQTYRMDIAQAAVPLLINPQTMQADVTTNVEIPLEGITPTITKVRGESIDFRYYIEVCLDLQGKLEISRLLPRLTAQPRYGFGKPSAGTNASVPLNLAAQGAHLIDTQLIRRERPQIIAWQFHVVIGTKDSGRVSSNRNRGGWKVGDGPILMPTGGPNGFNGGNVVNEHPRSGHLSDVQEDWNAEDSVSMHRAFSEGLESYNSDHVHEIDNELGNGYGWNHSSSNLSSAPTTHGTPPPPPPPPMSTSLPGPEGPLDEKTRLKQQEERLMPSAPPMDAGDAPGASGRELAPSAPPEGMFDGHSAGRWETEVSVGARDSGYACSGVPQQDQARPRLRQRPSHASHAISIEEGGHIQCSCGASRDATHLASGADGQDTYGGDNLGHHLHQHHQPSSTSRPPPSVTSQSQSRRSSSTRNTDDADPTVQPTDDKQELERRRLMAEQSAPTYEEPDEPGPSASGPGPSVPSAPALGELVEGENRHTAFGDWEGPHDDLPRYEK